MRRGIRGRAQCKQTFGALAFFVRNSSQQHLFPTHPPTPGRGPPVAIRKDAANTSILHFPSRVHSVTVALIFLGSLKRLFVGSTVFIKSLRNGYLCFKDQGAIKQSYACDPSKERRKFVTFYCLLLSIPTRFLHYISNCCSGNLPVV
jgi:hypothetical protein